MKLKRFISAFLAAAIVSVSGAVPDTVAADYETSICGVYEGANIERQDYGSWGVKTLAYLAPYPDGRLMKLQASDKSGEVDVEYYDSSYRLTEHKHIAAGLPQFGAHYYSEDGYNYILSGKVNENKVPEAEVYRLTKYDSDWNYISHLQIYGHESDYFLSIFEPFGAAGAYLTQVGNEIVIGSGRSMGYQGADHHQANITIYADMENMTYRLDNSAYTSHSFNHILRSDNGHLINLDQGDAYPRG